ncbi:NAD(P)-dependent oxidoreductase [Persicobacter diffluens]|uniref:dTDP-4-dehydrorhamnose reductase n=1 Tax=Persicobacter diffluens TaxID=981 RepID=A0AAN4W270_9BACT|nr:NAD(P)-dependent oxidoreductase [Persicobacter diffluens]
MNKLKILITGGKGFIAARLTQLLQGNNTVQNPDRKALDITNHRAVKNFIQDFQPDLIFHTAGMSTTEGCEANQQLAYQINVEATKCIAEQARAIGAKLIFFSTEQLFNGNPEKGPYTEESIPQPDTYYGKTKLWAEEAIREVCPEHWILRLTWVFGMPEREGKIGANILWSTLQAAYQKTDIKAAPNEYRGLTDVYELLHALTQITRIPFGTYHFGSENDLSRHEVVRQIMQTVNIPLDLLKEKKAPYRDIRLANGKLAEAGIHFEKSEVALQKAIEAYQL